ncbi:MAG: DNA-processing protein DprA [Gemmatimonadaceae bacterium]|nr:DNA-processing protein DprA [Gemmatimonadaceae bacterium]
MIIAALARCTVVVEAGEGSGALLTAAAATALGRDVAAVPGAFEAHSCRASNRLLRDGAQVIADEADLLTLAGLHGAAVAATRHERDAAPDSLDDAERAVWRALAHGALPVDEVVHRALPVDEVVHRAGWAADACLAAVTTLELRGLVRATAIGTLERA